MTPFERELREDIRAECVATGNPTHLSIIRFGNPRDDDETYNVVLYVAPKFVTGRIEDLVNRLGALFATPRYRMTKRLDNENEVGWTVMPGDG